MKSKTLKHIVSVVALVVVMITMFTMTTLKVNADENEYVPPTEAEAKIYGASVNLGGDISMKYYVEIGSGIDINSITLRTEILGVVNELTVDMDENDNPVVKEGLYYVFTLEGINPQCMGDLIDAKLYIDGVEQNYNHSSMLDYSVKDNLVNVYNDVNTKYNTKQLIIDTLEYGAAAQVYCNYKTDELVTDGLPEAMTAHLNDEWNNVNNNIPPSTPEVSETVTNSIKEASVLFSTTNFIKVSYTDGETKTLTSTSIAAYDFAKKMQFSVEGLFTLGYSVNDYCYDVTHSETTSDNMKALAQALYNYGLSAHFVKGNHSGGEDTATCVHGKICEICAHEYGERLEHNYTYTVNEESNTITESCDQGCNHNKTLTLKAPENAVYTGSSHEATVEGDIDAEYEITYNENPINAGTYTATLTVGENSVSVEYVVEKVNPTVVNPTSTTLTYTGDEQELISAGSTNFGTMVYSLSEDGEYTENIPTGINAGKYVVYYYVKGNENINDSEIASIEVEIAKAESTIKTHPEANDLTYTGVNQLLVTEGIFDGGTLVYALDENGEYTAAIPYGTNAGEYKVWYYVEGDLNHNDSEKHSIDVTIEKALPDYFSPVLEATYGQTLGDLNPDSGSLIITPGKWTWDDAPDTLVGDVGKHLFDVTFTPNNDNYQTIHTAAIVTVSALEIHSAAELFITLNQESFVYDGTAKEPMVISVTVNGVTLQESKDYTIAYENNVYVGDARVIIKFIGNYSGTVTKTFEITQDPKTTEFEGEWVTIPKN